MRKSIIAAAVLIACASTQASAKVKEQEMLGGASNDTWSTAQDLGSILSGDSLTVRGSRKWEQPGGASVDFYSFSLGSAANMSFSVDATKSWGDPTLGLFDSTGTLMAADDDSGAGLGSFLSTALNAGTYYVAVSGWSDMDFCDGTCGSGGWKYDLGITAAVPEPETYAMFLAGLGMIGAITRRRARKNAA